MIKTKSTPNHVAIIMDGNGRWALKNGKSRTIGHRAGSKNVMSIIETACEEGIKYITLYAFSTENWKRPEDERKALFNLLSEFYKKEIDRLIKNNILIKHIGDISKFPKQTQNIIRETEEKTSALSKNAKITVIIALNYGTYDEVKRGLIKFYEDVKSDKIDINSIEETTIFNYLDTKEIPNPDLLIRTSGEYRVSNFLLLQIAYTELYFTDTLWPDFSKEEFLKAIDSYTKRERRYGGISS